MNEVSKAINHLISTRCSDSAIGSLASSSFILNLIENFGRSFETYLAHKYHVRIVDIHTIDRRKNGNDLYIQNVLTQKYRPVVRADINVIHSIIRKWYQDFDDINLRIKLLFDSKYGTRFLSKKTHVDADLISKARHGRYPIRDMDGETRLQLENFYLNSKLATHIRRLKVNFNQI